MKKFLYILIIITALGFFGSIAESAENCSDREHRTKEDCVATGNTWTADPGYQLLEPLPCDSSMTGCENGKLTTFDPTQPNNLGVYLNIMIKIIIGLAAVLSVVMIVVGGIEYMTSELSHTKEAGKEKILHAVLGLLIALGAYALLYTINPDILKTDLDPTPANPTTTRP